MTNDALLHRLRIDRSEKSRRSPGGGPPWMVIAIVAVLVLAAVGALAWYLVAEPDRVPVRAATAVALSPGVAGQGAALLDASGYVVARRQATVSSKITGMVQQVLIEEGDHVQAGQVIARLDPSNAGAAEAQSRAQVGQAQANIILAQANLANADIKYRRYRGAAGQGIIATQAIDDTRTADDSARASLAVSRSQLAVSQAELQVAERNLDDTIVRAPFAGVVTVKAAQPGEIVSPVSAGGGFTRTGICTIVDMDSLEVEVDVAESFINRVSQGMPAVVWLNAYPDWQIPADVIAVIPTADRSKATVTVRVELKAKDARIVPDMGARVTFLSPAPGGARAAAAQRGVIVPADAIKTEDSGQAVAFVIGDGRVERRAVGLGPQDSRGQVVLAGLQPGEVVAISDKPLTDGAKVRLVKGDASSQ
ncbi:MAG TPA: efflux RND transporter periplasmic adaptor subunit [Caulobacteraceae bacterium]|jgi:RND family efflux transporter MFP subunit|nr:efflux RND transporter periplasmic adaptor subunit [Caulobacteraceae bacterium]